MVGRENRETTGSRSDIRMVSGLRFEGVPYRVVCRLSIVDCRVLCASTGIDWLAACHVRLVGALSTVQCTPEDRSEVQELCGLLLRMRSL